MESYHAVLKRRILVSHHIMFSFLSHLQRATSYSEKDRQRLQNGLHIRRPKKKANMLNETRIKACLARFDNGSYSRLQFLRAISHSVGAHTDNLMPNGATSSDSDDDAEDAPAAATSSATDNTASLQASVADCCEVCLLAPRALVPYGLARFCASCVDTVTLTAAGSSCQSAAPPSTWFYAYSVDINYTSVTQT